MTGIEALEALRNGKKIKRKVWDEGQFILFSDPNVMFEDNNHNTSWPFAGLYHSILMGFVKEDDWEIVE